jgi:hypothetical protein
VYTYTLVRRTCSKPDWDGMGGYDYCGRCVGCRAPERAKAITTMAGSALTSDPTKDEWLLRLNAAKFLDAQT